MDTPFKMHAAKLIWELCSDRERRSAIVLFFLFVVATLVETLGIGLVIPAVSIMAQSNSWALDVLRSIPILSGINREGGIVIGLLALLIVYLFKAVFLAFVAWYQSKFLFNLDVDLSKRLFSGYLHQDYAYHVQRNSAPLIRNATNLVVELTHLVQLLLMLASELLVLVAVSILLVILEPAAAMVVVGVLGVAGWWGNRLVRQKISEWGARREVHENRRIQHIQQGLGGIKEIKLSGTEAVVAGAFQADAVAIARILQYWTTLRSLPRLWFEVLMVAALVLLVLVMLQQGRPLEAVLPTLGVFGAGAFRLMPSANRIMDALQSLRFRLPAVEVLNKELTTLVGEPPLTNHPPFSFTDAIAFDGVLFRYEGASRPALLNVSMKISRGASVGIIGGSGAGKSTLVDVLIGLLRPTGGAVRVDGVDIVSNLRGWRQLIGYVPQSIYLTDDTIRANIAFGVPRAAVDNAALWKALELAQLADFVRELPEGLDTFVGERGVRLSGGQRQRIGIARALYRDPPVLVLDEATSSLDVATEKEIMKAVSALQGVKTLIIVAHRFATVEACDWIFRLEQGRLKSEGRADAILSAWQEEHAATEREDRDRGGAP